MIDQTRRCPTCGERSTVEEDSTGSVMQRDGEYEYHFLGLSCGHQIDGPLVRVAGLPQEAQPFAGTFGVGTLREFRSRHLHEGGRVKRL